MNIRNYLDSTYLKTADQAGLSVADNIEAVKSFVREAIDEQFKLVMVRPDMVAMAKAMVVDARSAVGVGTVISFPLGTDSLEQKYAEAQKAIADGADDLDFVCNYQAFKEGGSDVVKKEVVALTRLALDHHKTAKWIIEVAALSDTQIIQLSALIKNVVMSNFGESQLGNVFVKSSTGFYPTQNGQPNGATPDKIILMLENASPLPVKAAGGVRDYDAAVEMIRMGVKRIGTSSAKAIAGGAEGASDY